MERLYFLAQGRRRPPPGRSGAVDRPRGRPQAAAGMTQIRWTPQAVEDLEAHPTATSPATPRTTLLSWLSGLFAAVDTRRLSGSPDAIVPELQRPDLREAILGLIPRCLPPSGRVTPIILTVFHGAPPVSQDRLRARSNQRMHQSGRGRPVGPGWHGQPSPRVGSPPRRGPAGDARSSDDTLWRTPGPARKRRKSLSVPRLSPLPIQGASRDPPPSPPFHRRLSLKMP